MFINITVKSEPTFYLMPIRCVQQMNIRVCLDLRLAEGNRVNSGLAPSTMLAATHTNLNNEQGRLSMSWNL